MFGYVMPLKNELKFREYDCYRRYYCGVCKSIGRRYGQVKRLGLVNEAALLSVILDCITEEAASTKWEEKGCVAHPAQKIPAVKDSVYTDYAADVNILMDYYKLQDNWHDDRNVLAAAAGGAFKRAAAKAGKRNPEVAASIKENIGRLSELEKTGTADLDRPAHCFAAMMQDVFTNAPEIKKRITSGSEEITAEKFAALSALGYHIGKWIYLADAVYDVKKDEKKHSYNPVILVYGKKPEEKLQDFLDRIKEPMQFLMFDSLGKCTEAWETLSWEAPDDGVFKDLKAVVNNVILLGMRANTERGFMEDGSVSGTGRQQKRD